MPRPPLTRRSTPTTTAPSPDPPRPTTTHPAVDANHDGTISLDEFTQAVIFAEAKFKAAEEDSSEPIADPMVEKVREGAGLGQGSQACVTKLSTCAR